MKKVIKLITIFICIILISGCGKNKVLKCEIKNDQSKSGYTINTTYEIYSSDSIVNKVVRKDVVTSKNTTILAYFEKTLKDQYKIYHFEEFLDLCIDIIREKFPEYYPYAISFLKNNEGNFFNVFIMKQNDFIKWGEFVFGVLLEFDKKLNLTSDNDIQLLVRNEKRKTVNRYNLEHNFRLEGFIIERLGNIFYDKHFSRRYERRLVKGKW